MNVSLEQDLYQAAKDLIKQRYPIGWGGGAAIRTKTGKILTSVAPDVKNDSLSLCIEVGAYLEAYKLDEVVTHSLCCCRKDEKSDFLILSPCGICQERLVYWGVDVKVAISAPENQLTFKTIRELQPYHWSLTNGELL